MGSLTELLILAGAVARLLAWAWEELMNHLASKIGMI